MNETQCDRVQERLPELAAGILPAGEADALRAHLDACDDCRDTWRLVTLLREGRPAAPADLASRIEGSVRFRRRSVSRPWWGLAAAAVAALALGIGVTADRGATPDVPAFVAGTDEATLWLSDDGLVAGAPTLGDLSDEALMTLLEEMGSGPSGGAA